MQTFMSLGMAEAVLAITHCLENTLFRMTGEMEDTTFLTSLTEIDEKAHLEQALAEECLM